MRLVTEISNLDSVEMIFQVFQILPSENLKNLKNHFPQDRDLRFRPPIAFRGIHAALLRRRRILRRVQRTKKPEVLFNRVVKRICEFVLATLFEATCKRRAVSEVQNRVPATSRSGQILCVRQQFFLQTFFELVPDDFKGVIEKRLL